MTEEDDWKQKAIQHDMAVFGARARRAGANERRYVDMASAEDLRAEIARGVPDIKRFLKVGRV